MCVLPCIFGYENWKMQQDPEYARAMQKPMIVLHLFIITGEALFVAIFGMSTWTGISEKCKAMVPGDLYTLFMITVVLWTITATFTACSASCMACMLCGLIP